MATQQLGYHSNVTQHHRAMQRQQHRSWLQLHGTTIVKLYSVAITTHLFLQPQV